MESFDRFATDYNNLLSDPLRQKFARDDEFFIHQKCRVLMRHLRQRTTGRLRLLDAGCGHGTAIAFLSKDARVIGTDVSLPMLREAGLDRVEQGYLLFLPETLWKWFGFLEPALAWIPLGGQYFVSGENT